MCVATIRWYPIVVVIVGLISAPGFAADQVFTLDPGDGFVIENSSSTEELFRIDDLTGDISRNGGLFLHTRGTGNLCVGNSAGSALMTGEFNTAFGFSALSFIQSGARNSAFGVDALSRVTTGSENAAFGDRALASVFEGSENSAFGSGALTRNDSGGRNSAFGWNAMRRNTRGFANSAFRPASVSQPEATTSTSVRSVHQTMTR